MCGIIGSINFEISDSLLQTIKHRGPDGGGRLERFVCQHKVTLGHRRLAILDLSSAGYQPMCNANAQHLITYNGEVYNHSFLRTELTDISWVGHSDTETVLNLLAQKGVDALSYLNGIYALGYLDILGGKFYLARDPFGVKPLYYTQHGESLIFASEMRPLTKIIQERLDPIHLSALLRLRYVPSPDTLYRSIKKVRPGHVVEVDLRGNSIALNEYPFTVFSTGSHGMSGLGAITRSYGTTFDQAIHRQLMSDVEVGVLLSGGLDSALVARAAQAAAPYRMKAFTVGFKGGGETDEIDAARVTAEAIRLDHHVVRMDFEGYLDALRTCIQIVEEPLATTSMVPMFHLSRLAAQHVKVVLSGQGADELLGGYGRYQMELWRRWVPPWIARMTTFAVRTMGYRGDQLRRGASALSIGDEIDRFLRAYEVFSPEEIIRLTGIEDSLSRQRIEENYRQLKCEDLATGVERMMALDLRMNLADDLLLYTDKITMHHALECRVPMLDHELVRFVEGLHNSCRVRLGSTKVVHKRYAEQVLPKYIVARRKKGFQSPTKQWFLKKSRVDDLLQDRTSQFAQTFNLKAVNSVLQEHRRGYNCERQIFLLLGIRFWMDDAI